MHFPRFSLIGRLLLATVIHHKIIFTLAGLCEDNADICELVTGSYTDHDGNSQPWWAFNPIGSAGCPPVGCPLYVWIDGTDQAPYQVKPDQYYMLEMLKRGFVAVNVGYDASTLDYGGGCNGIFLLNFGGFTDKAQEIFDGNVADSVVTQLCDGTNALANCDLGIASHGWSQGAHIAVLGGNYDTRVSASLLFGNGNSNSITGGLSCLNNGNLNLPRERRRSIAGDSDDYFGGDFAGVLQQQKQTSGYDCATNRNCFTKLPEGCSYAAGEGFCEEYDRFFTLACPACDIVPAEGPCPSNTGLQTNACPVEVPDTYLGGAAMIEGSGGYYIISGDEYCAYAGCDPAGGAPHGFFQNLDEASDFLKPETKWGLVQNLDWLARIARKTAAAPQTPSPTVSPTPSPTKSPAKPTTSPTGTPTASPSRSPTKSPAKPTASPTSVPTTSPSHSPTKSPVKPTASPTGVPTTSPSRSPTKSPVKTTASPTSSPTASSVTKYLCNKNSQSTPDICAAGLPTADSQCNQEGDPCGGPKKCWIASCSTTGNPPPPPTGTPAPTPPTTTTCDSTSCACNCTEYGSSNDCRTCGCVWKGGCSSPTSNRFT